jgi:hypothetical protein
MPFPFGRFTIFKTAGVGKSETLTSCLASGEVSEFDMVAFLEEERAALAAALSAPPDLMSTTAPPPRWMPGDFKPSWSISDLRAFGFGWRAIENLTMAGPVKWEPGERERLLGEAP